MRCFSLYRFSRCEYKCIIQLPIKSHCFLLCVWVRVVCEEVFKRKKIAKFIEKRTTNCNSNGNSNNKIAAPFEEPNQVNKKQRLNQQQMHPKIKARSQPSQIYLIQQPKTKSQTQQNLTIKFIE